MNKFLKHAKEIREISISQNVDLGVALDIFCLKNGMKKDEDGYAFLEMCRKTPLDEIIENL